MSIALEPITPKDLTPQEKDSILSHAIDLHLVGSDEADSVGFDIVEKKSTNVLHLFRVVDGKKHVGVVYLLPVQSADDLAEMTVLIYPEFRGKHYTASLVEQIEQFMRKRSTRLEGLCASVHDHNPMRKELTEFLLRHGYGYSPEHRMFLKRLG